MINTTLTNGSKITINQNKIDNNFSLILEKEDGIICEMLFKSIDDVLDSYFTIPVNLIKNEVVYAS